MPSVDPIAQRIAKFIPKFIPKVIPTSTPAGSSKRIHTDIPKRISKRTSTRLAWVGAGILLAVAVLVMVRPKPVIVDVGTVDRGPLIVTLVEEGQTHVRERTTITAPTAGHLVRGPLRAGDRIHQDDVLAQLHPAAAPLVDARARAELEAVVRAAAARVEEAHAVMQGANAARDQAMRDERHSEALWALGAIAKTQLDAARTTTAQAAARVVAAWAGVQAAVGELARARAAASSTMTSKVRDGPVLALQAPWTGIALAVVREHDGWVAPGEPLYELAKLETLEVRVPCLTDDAASFTPGMHATVRGLGPSALRAHLTRVEPKAFTRISALGVEEQRVDVLFALDADADALKSRSQVGHGWAVDVDIELWRSDDVVRVPAGALFRRGDGWSVFVVDEGRARRRDATIGHRAGELVEVISGLAPGDRVVLYPADRVEDGVRVSPRAMPDAGATVALAASPEAISDGSAWRWSDAVTLPQHRVAHPHADAQIESSHTEMTPVRCPHCKRPIPPLAVLGLDGVPMRPSWAPFCSDRCKLADLQKWLGGAYAIAGRPLDEDESAALVSADASIDASTDDGMHSSDKRR